MRIFHIGPSKTASTSIQAVIPSLGVPYLIKPTWAKRLCRARAITLSQFKDVPENLIISAEIVGDFDTVPAAVVSERIHAVLGPVVIVYVHRDREERCRSLYGQFLKNNPGKSYAYEIFRERLIGMGKTRRLGPYSYHGTSEMALDFKGHIFRSVEFSLLKLGPRAFMEAFCRACETPAPEVGFPHLNAS